MKRFLLGTAASLAVTGSAMAADLPAKAPPRAAPPVALYNWTGCYVAGGGGYGMFNQDVATNLADGEVTIGGRGWFGTVGAGCDVQFGGWVLGAFGDYDFGGPRGDFVLRGFDITGREKQESAWAVGGRLGYLLTPTILTYFNAGYTQSRFDAFNLSDGSSIGANTYSGWFLGGGYEYRMDWFPGLFWRTEYRFAQYDRDNLTFLEGGVPNTDVSISSEKTIQTIRSELVWRFNWGGRY